MGGINSWDGVQEFSLNATYVHDASNIDTCGEEYKTIS